MTKRLFDLVLASLAAVVLLPVIAVLIPLVRAKLGSPVFFRQVRPGLGGRPFEMIKFRTMTDARAADGTLLPDAQRLTSFGRFLRATSLDELPELWNVLRGDMSLVGPRPAPPREVDIYDPWHRRRLSMKPGLTGLWQVSSRLDEDFDERASLDLQYIDRWSLLLDLKIVARTVPAVIRPTGN